MTSHWPDTDTPSPDVTNYDDLLRTRVIAGATGVLLASDVGKVIECTFAGVVALTVPAGMPAGANFIVQKTNAATDVTVTATGATIDGAANLRIGGAAGIGSAPFRRSSTNALVWYSA